MFKMQRRRWKSISYDTWIFDTSKTKLRQGQKKKKQTRTDPNVNFKCLIRYLRMTAELFEGENLRLTPGFLMSKIRIAVVLIASFLCKVQSSLAIGWHGGAGNGHVPGNNQGCDKGSSGGGSQKIPIIIWVFDIVKSSWFRYIKVKSTSYYHI